MRTIHPSRARRLSGKLPQLHWLTASNPRHLLLIFALSFLPLCLAWAGALQPKASPHDLEFRRVDVTILARGSSIISSTGNMDSYLAVISGGRHAEPVAARLVRYYPFFADSLSEEQMAAGRVFHMRLTYAQYCGMQAKDFVVRQAFDADAIAKLQNADSQDKQDKQVTLPCFIVRP